MLKSKKSILPSVSYYWLAAGAVALLILGGGAYTLLTSSSATKTQTIPAKPSPAPTAQVSQPTPSSKSSSNTPQPQPSSQKESQSSGATALITPNGQFVSNHNPSLSGSKEMYSESSVCNTTPGATCFITFTMGSTVKKLEAREANTNGAVFWEWDIKSAGLSEGTWTVTATATLNGSTKSTQDSQNLQVQP